MDSTSIVAGHGARIGVFAAIAAVALLARPARADGALALDYASAVEGCPSAAQLGERVAIRLGRDPWRADAPALTVRITADGPDVIGTITRPDGTHRALRAPDCVLLGKLLTNALSDEINQGVAPPPAPRPRVTGPIEITTDALVEFRVPTGQRLSIFRIRPAQLVPVDNGTLTAHDEWFEPLCRAPCTARLPRGRQQLLLRDLATGGTARVDAPVDEDSVLNISYVSNAPQRHRHRKRVWLGALIGTAAVTGVIEIGVARNPDSTRGDYLIAPLLGAVTGGLVGAAVARLTARGGRDDEATISRALPELD